MGQALLQLWLLSALAADVIAIESNASDRELAALTIASCGEALGAGACHAELAPGAPGPWFARVVWEDPEQLRVRIEIRHGTPEAEPESVRVVEFSASDELGERHRAVGLIIASYVADRARERERSAQAAAEPEQPEQPLEPESAARYAAAGLDLALLAGTALDRGGPRIGATVRGFFRPADVPVAPTLALRGAYRSGTESVLFGSASAGALVTFDPSGLPLAVELRAELLAERVQVRAGDSAMRRTETAGRWRFGGLLGAEVHLALGRGFALFLGGDAQLLTPSVVIEVGGERAGRASAFGAAGVGGVRLMH